MEHAWGNIWRAVAGWVNDAGTQKVKLTYGQSDGSTINGYSCDGNGYIPIADSKLAGSSGSHITKMHIDENGIVPVVTNGSTSTYFCDVVWYNNNAQINYAITGGSSGNGADAGMYAVVLNDLATNTNATVGAAISCKPLAPTT